MKLGTNDISSVYLGSNAVQKVYLGTNEVWSAFDADAQAFFDRVTTAGGTLSNTEKSAVNTLVVQMKADGIWTKMKAIYPMVGASAAACAQNLKSSSFTGSFTTGWNFSSDGITINSSSSALDTKLIPSTQLSFNNMHMALYCRNNPTKTGDGGDMGVQIGSNRMNLALYRSFSAVDSAVVDISFNPNVNNAYPNNNSIGFWLGNVTSSTNNKLYKNGVNVLTNTDNNNYTSYSVLTSSIAIGAINLGTSFSISSGARNYALASIGDGLTDTEASDFYTAVQAFQTTLNRQV